MAQRLIPKYGGNIHGESNAESSLPALRISAKRVNRRRRRMTPEIVVMRLWWQQLDVLIVSHRNKTEWFVFVPSLAEHTKMDNEKRKKLRVEYSKDYLSEHADAEINDMTLSERLRVGRVLCNSVIYSIARTSSGRPRPLWCGPRGCHQVCHFAY